MMRSLPLEWVHFACKNVKLPFCREFGLGDRFAPDCVRHHSSQNVGFSLLIDSLGGGVVVVSSMLSLVAFGALLLIPMSTAKNAIGDASVKQAR